MNFFFFIIKNSDPIFKIARNGFLKRVPKFDFLIKEQNESSKGKSKYNCLIKKHNGFLK